MTSPRRLNNILKGVEDVQRDTSLIFIKYSSTNQALTKKYHDRLSSFKNLITLNTVSYHAYLGLLRNSSFVITDSSGIQDETAFLGIPCILCRETSHRFGLSDNYNDNKVSDDPEKIISETKKALSTNEQNSSYPLEWDIDVANSIASIFLNYKEEYDKFTWK